LQCSSRRKARGAASWRASCPSVGSSDRPMAGFQTAESTPALGKAPPFAGQRWNAGLGRHMRATGASSPPPEVPMTERGARSEFRGGELHPRHGRQPAAEFGEVLRSGLIGLHVPMSPFNGRRRKRRPGPDVAASNVPLGRGPSGSLRSLRLAARVVGLLKRACSSQRSSPRPGGAFFDGGRCAPHVPHVSVCRRDAGSWPPCGIAWRALGLREKR